MLTLAFSSSWWVISAFLDRVKYTVDLGWFISVRFTFLVWLQSQIVVTILLTLHEQTFTVCTCSGLVRNESIWMLQYIFHKLFYCQCNFMPIGRSYIDLGVGKNNHSSCPRAAKVIRFLRWHPSWGNLGLKTSRWCIAKEERRAGCIAKVNPVKSESETDSLYVWFGFAVSAEIKCHPRTENQKDKMKSWKFIDRYAEIGRATAAVRNFEKIEYNHVLNVK